jgi:hypothetical protein
MMPDKNPDPVFGQPGWRRRMEDHYGWDKEFMATGIILVLVLVSIGLARAGGEDTGLPQDDPKDLSSQQAQPAPCDPQEYFLPMPGWSHFVKMPPLPGTLTPMGKSPTIAKPQPAAVAETKPDAAPMPKPAVKAKPAPAQTPDFVAVSPFLQWVKDHPQEAAAQAQKQAGTYNAIAPAAPIGVDPYWMPPMIDNGNSTGPVTGSAAIYSTPQR